MLTALKLPFTFVSWILFPTLIRQYRQEIGIFKSIFSPFVCRFWVASEGPTKCFEHISRQIEICDGDRASICIWSGLNATWIELNSNYSPLIYCLFMYSFNSIFNGFHHFFLPLEKKGDCTKKGFALFLTPLERTCRLCWGLINTSN